LGSASLKAVPKMLVKLTQRLWAKVSTSPTFYKQLFCTKVFSASFLCLQYGLVIFWQKEIGTKAAHARKMLVKFTTCCRNDEFKYNLHFIPRLLDSFVLTS